jgi:cobalt-zinc-cadmium efflux system membrane fusion protein
MDNGLRSLRQSFLLVILLLLPALLQACDNSKTPEGGSNTGISAGTNTSTGSTPETKNPANCSQTHLVSLTPDAENDAAISVASAEFRNIQSDVDVTGEVLANANTQTHVTTPITGRVTKILVSIGDFVKTGQELMIVRSTDIQQAESDLLQGEQQVRSDLKQALVQIDCDTATAEAQLKFDEKSYNRIKGLYEEKVASQADFQAAETQYQKDKISLDALVQKRASTVALSNEKMKLVTGPAKTKLRLLGIPDSEIENVMKTQVVDPMDTVVAPADGVVVERLVNVGELVDPTKPLFTIGNFDTVWLKADVFEKDIAKVKLGQNIELRVDSFPDHVFKGKLDYLANQVDADTRTLAVRAAVVNQSGHLKPKMFARMKIIVGDQRVLAIPSAAVQDTRLSKVVYVPKGNNQFEERKVKLGSQDYDSDYIEVLEGLKAGEKVVTHGSIDLRAKAVRTYSS